MISQYLLINCYSVLKGQEHNIQKEESSLSIVR